MKALVFLRLFLIIFISHIFFRRREQHAVIRLVTAISVHKFSSKKALCSLSSWKIIDLYKESSFSAVYRRATAAGTVSRVPGRSTCIGHTKDELRRPYDGRVMIIWMLPLGSGAGGKQKRYENVLKTYWKRSPLTPDRQGSAEAYLAAPFLFRFYLPPVPPFLFCLPGLVWVEIKNATKTIKPFFNQLSG